ncbi:MAG TPA: chemotaxis protein CheB [Chthoniobacterales bacterium]
MSEPSSLSQPSISRDIVVIGASAGGVEALQKLVAGLPARLPAAIFIVLHTRADGPNLLPQILQRHSALEIASTENGLPIEHGKVYVAPPDRHLLLLAGRIRVVHGPKENRHRPAIDPLFRSAAWTYGPRVIGVILSGTMDDGSAGLWAVRSCGGATVVQDPSTALFPGMINHALATVAVDHIVPIGALARTLVTLVKNPALEEPTAPDATVRERLSHETRQLADFIDGHDFLGKIAEPSAFVCPECSGSLWKLQDGSRVRFRCHVGHAFSLESLFQGQTERIEEALYNALQVIEENGRAGQLLIDLHRKHGTPDSAEFHARIQQLQSDAEVLRQLLRGMRSGEI